MSIQIKNRIKLKTMLHLVCLYRKELIENLEIQFNNLKIISNVNQWVTFKIHNAHHLRLQNWKVIHQISRRVH